MTRWRCMYLLLVMIAIIIMLPGAALAMQDETSAEDAAAERMPDDAAADEATPAPLPPSDVTAGDHPWDEGTKIDLSWVPSPSPDVKFYRIEIRDVEAEADADWKLDQMIAPAADDLVDGRVEYTASDLELKKTYDIRVSAINEALGVSEPVAVPPIKPTIEWFMGSRGWLLIIVFVFCGAVVFWINHARSGKPIKVRPIAGLEAVDEAVGRATEMGRSCLYVPGIQDINDIQTIAGITILSRVAKTAAEYDAKVEVPTARSLVMTTAREAVQASYLSAGRPDAYNQDLIYYVTDEQFGYVAYLQGMMVREKPAACFYMGAFFAESLILAETGNSIGAIQVAGTAMPAQLPFFVAACDYTLIGEEFFAASAYLSGSPEELGSLKGQDVGKIIVAVVLVIGVVMATIASATGSDSLQDAVSYLKDTVLS